MKRLNHILALSVFASLGGSATAANIAGSGTGILGVHTTIDATLGTPYIRTDQPGPGMNPVRITDGIYGTNGSFGALIDTWNGAPAASGTFAYVGVTGMTIPVGEHITNVTLNIGTAGDGGWFGPNNSGPGAGQPLTGAHLIVPTVQVTSDGGTTWSNVGASANDYIANMTGHVIGNGGQPNPTFTTVSFNLDTPQLGIDGIRLIGSEGGGPAGADAGGFLALAEFEVNTSLIPEPSAFALVGLAGLGLVMRRRR